MRENGSPPPEFETDEDRTSFLNRLPVHERAAQGLSGGVTPQVTPQVQRVASAIRGEQTGAEIMANLGLKDRMHFANEYLHLPWMPVWLK